MTTRLAAFAVATLVFVFVFAKSGVALADDVPSPTASAPDAFWTRELDAGRETSKAPYTPPFQLRGVIPKPGVRLDTVLGLYQTNDRHEQITVILLSGQLRVTEGIALQVRWGIDSNQTGNDTSRTGIVNPTLGALVGLPLGHDFRFAASMAVGAPLATGGGDWPDANRVALQREGALARSAMDNVSFSVNDVGFPTGSSLAFVKAGVTAQVDATIIPSVRVKAAATQPDTHKVNSTYGFFLGYLFVRELSIGAELRYQRYLTTPAAVAKDEAARDNLTIALGPRFVLELTESVSLRPAVTYGHGLRGPISQQSFQIVQLDLPVSF